jgi:LDH2 family malate/lactate/ureidoglycolate dehydrogenase
MRTIQALRLEGWTSRMFAAAGMSDEHAGSAARMLVDTSLRGIDTHGISRVPTYMELLAQGDSKAKPDIRIEDRGAFLVIDADRALGQVAGPLAMTRAILRAKETGFVAAVIRDIGHMGALGYFTRMAADAGMLAILMQNAPPMMSLPGAAKRGIGNNPMSFAAPVAGKPPLVLDMAASEAAFGKIIEASRSGAAIPAGWALDKDGEPTLDSRAAFAGMLLPMGGVKGIGLAMMVEAFAGSLSGVSPARMKRGSQLSYAFGAFLIVADPEAIVGRAAFDAHLAEWMTTWMQSGGDVRYPGERTAAIHAERSAAGIPVNDEVAQALTKAGAAAGVPFTE